MEEFWLKIGINMVTGGFRFVDNVRHLATRGRRTVRSRMPPEVAAFNTSGLGSMK